MKYIVVMACLGILVAPAEGQVKTRKLPNSISHPAINHFAPYMSADGDAIVFLTDNSEDYQLTPFFSFRTPQTDWREPVALPKSLFNRLSFLNGYTLGPEGRFLYLSTMKSPGVGGFDLWVSERTGNTWSEPKNLAVPVNSRSHEACATLSPDSRSIYFMRCENMDQKSASGCRIMVSHKKSNGQWDEPVELPAQINTGNSQAPRILADGETLIFSSDQMNGGKGGMDLYQTRLSNGMWSRPVAMDFVNTEKDDQFVSVNAIGRYLLRDSPAGRKRQLMEYLIPASLRPKGLMRVEGKVAGADQEKVAAYISLIDLESGKRVYDGRPDKGGAFALYLREGGRYKLAIDPEQGQFGFYSKLYDLTTDSLKQIDKISAVLPRASSAGDQPLELVSFTPQSATLTAEAEDELKRLSRWMMNSPDVTFEIQVMLAGFEQDSVQSSPDLTEVTADSVHTIISFPDSAGQIMTVDSLMIKTYYHNDRTVAQAESIKNFLILQGVPEGQMTFLSNARPEAIVENRKLDIVVRPK